MFYRSNIARVIRSTMALKLAIISSSESFAKHFLRSNYIIEYLEVNPIKRAIYSDSLSRKSVTRLYIECQDRTIHQFISE